MYTLYGGKFTRAIINEMVMAEGDIEFELINVDTSAMEQVSPEFLKLNPAGWVPVLVTPEGDNLYETPAISLYLAEHHELTHLVPKIDDPVRGMFLSAYFYITDELEPALKRYFFPHRYADGDNHAPAVTKKAYNYVMKCLDDIDKRIAGNGPYQLGKRYSLVDLVVAHWAVTIEQRNVLDDLPNLRELVKLVENRPKLVPLFAKLRTWQAEYYELYARGEGVGRNHLDWE